MGGRGLLAAVIGAMALCTSAHAFPQDHLKQAREALSEGDRRGVRDALDAAESSFVQTDGIAPNDVLATYWVYRGLLEHMRGQSDAAMDAFREALVVDHQHVWDKELVSDRELRKVFEALRGEVEGRDLIATRVPEQTGCATVYVDGSRVRAGESVGIGRRFAQVQCPHGDVHGLWTTFTEREPIDWLAMCPYSVDTSIAPVESEPSEFEGLDVGFGGTEDAVDDPCIALLAIPPPVVAVPAEEEASEGSPGKSSGPGFIARNMGKDSWTTPRALTVGAGGAMIATGVILHYAIVVPAYDMVEWGRRNTVAVSRYQADILTERFRTRRTVAYSLTAAGAATAAAGLVFMRAKPSSIQPVFSPMGAGLAGRF